MDQQHEQHKQQLQSHTGRMIVSLSPLLSNKKNDKNNYDDSSSDHDSLASEPTTTTDNTSSSPHSMTTKTTTSSSRCRRRRNPHQVEDALWNIQKLRLSSQLTREKLFGDNGANQQAVREARNSRDAVYALLNSHYYY